MPEILDNKIAFLPSARAVDRFETWPLKRALSAVKKGLHKNIVEKARTAFRTDGKDSEVYKTLKLNLPSFAFNGIFFEKVVNAGFIGSSSLFHYDIDGLTPQQLSETRALLCGLPSTAFLFLSTSGGGLKGAAYIDPDLVQDDSSFKKVYAKFETYFASLGVTIDPSCKDVRRLCFTSYDPDLYYNKNPEVFDLGLVAPLHSKPEVYEDGYSPITLDDESAVIIAGMTLKKAEECLPKAGDQTRKEWLDVGMRLHFQFEGSDEALSLFDTWSQNVREYKGFDDVAKEWATFGKRKTGSMVDMRSLVAKHNRERVKVLSSRDLKAVDKIKSLLEECEDYMALTRDVAPILWRLADSNVSLEILCRDGLIARYSVLHPSHHLTKMDALRALRMRHKRSSSDLHKTGKLIADDEGGYPATITNVVSAVACPKFCGYNIGYDAFTDAIMIHQGDGQWQAFTDVHYTDLKIALVNRNFRDVSTERIKESVLKVAHSNVFDSAQSWLNSLEWDNLERIELFLHLYLGCPDTPYTRAVSLYIWSALAGRVLEPGCKADMVPIMKGGQGTFKSTAVAAITPAPEYFCTFSFDEKEDDVARKFRGKLVAELEELRGLGTKDSEHIKGFLARQREEWTPKYREFVTVYPRRVIIFGTTNEEFFLHDPTGHRRMLPFDVGRIDTLAVMRDREQLWAEGAELFKSSGVCFKEAETLAKAEHGRYVANDGFEYLVARWLKSDDAIDAPDLSEGITTLEILAGACGIEAKFAGQYNRRQITTTMKKLGYELKQGYRGADKERVKGYFWHKLPEVPEIDWDNLI